MSKPIIAIVGRPNVGKSTLFNRIAKKRVSIVEDIPGVTRDRLYMDGEWLDRQFTMIDTGGIELETEDTILAQTRQQAKLAMDEADMILFMVDGKTGLTTADEEVAALLRRSGKPVLVAVNKIDSFKDEASAYEFYNLGLGDPIALSATNALNLGDLLDEIVKRLPPMTEGENEDDEQIKVAFIGRPNVGKSSLVNALLGEERVIVSDVPGTTRDAIDTHFEKEGQAYVLIDTAGMRRKAKVDEAIERYSVMRSLRAVDRSDVVLMVLDGVDGITEQDKKIAGYAHEAGKGIVVVVNKWDLVEKDDKTTLRYTDVVRQELPFMQYAPVVFTSALTHQRVHRLLEVIKYVADQHAMRVATGVLNQIIEDAVNMNPAPSVKGKRLKIYYGTQVSVKPPAFVLFVNEPEIVHFSYQRYLENKLREAFGFEGTPIRLVLRGKKEEKA